VLRLLERGDVVPEIDQSLLSKTFTTMAGLTLPSTVALFGEALQDYKDLRPHDMELFDSKHVNQMLNYAGKDYLTACRNHIVLNISARVGKAFKLFFDALPQDFGAEDRNKARRYFMRYMTREEGPDEELSMWNSFKRVPTVETQAAVVEYVNRNLEWYADLQLDIGGLQPTKKVEKRWWDYLAGCTTCSFSHRSTTQGPSASCRSAASPFSTKHMTIDTWLLLRVAVRTKHMTIDTWLLLRVAVRTKRERPKDVTSFRNVARTHWEAHFKLSKAEGNNKKRHFEYMLKTDGYVVSVNLSKARVESTGHRPQRQAHRGP
jgi:hypothetical protein